eukprot:1141478-Pelagomonas_calceolata.AAC.3
MAGSGAGAPAAAAAGMLGAVACAPVAGPSEAAAASQATFCAFLKQGAWLPTARGAGGMSSRGGMHG